MGNPDAGAALCNARAARRLGPMAGSTSRRRRAAAGSRGGRCRCAGRRLADSRAGKRVNKAGCGDGARCICVGASDTDTVCAGASAGPAWHMLARHEETRDKVNGV